MRNNLVFVRDAAGFNEAGGILPPEWHLPDWMRDYLIRASMRPGGFSPRSGVLARAAADGRSARFNEAGGILPPECAQTLAPVIADPGLQ